MLIMASANCTFAAHSSTLVRDHEPCHNGAHLHIFGFSYGSNHAEKTWRQCGSVHQAWCSDLFLLERGGGWGAREEQEGEEGGFVDRNIQVLHTWQLAL